MITVGNDDRANATTDTIFCRRRAGMFAAAERGFVRMSCMIVRLSLLLVLLWSAPASAQQNVRVRVDNAGIKLDLPAQLFRPTGNGRFAAVAIFHGCGGPGQNTARMAGLMRDWGYVALVVDSFSSRGLTDVCSRNWPSQADAEKRAGDIDAALQWLAGQNFVDAKRLAFMGYSYGGGVAMLRVLSSQAADAAPIARAAILLYPDCALADALGPKLAVRQPTL